jgi:hypothetical protein
MIIWSFLPCLNNDLLEDFVIAHHPTLLREIESAREEYRREGGVSHEQMKKLIQQQSEE